MPARTLPNLGLKAGYDPGENGWADDMTLNLLKLSVLSQGYVLSKVAAEPGSPTVGDVHILDETHATHPNEVIVYDGPTGEEEWVYIEPNEGWLVYNQAANYYEKFDGTEWAELATGGGGGSPVAVDDEGVEIVAAVARINFEGDGVIVTDEGGDEVRVLIPGGDSGSTPTVRAANSQSSSANSYVITWPSGTVENDVVFIFAAHGFGITPPTGWAELDQQVGSQINGAILAKQMTAADITAGSVTVPTTGTFNGVFIAVTIDGATMARIRLPLRSIRSSSGASSVTFAAPGPVTPDLVLMFAMNRGASNNTFSGTNTSIATRNATDASGAVASTTDISKLGIVRTASFSSAGSGYYVGAIAIVGP